MSTRLTACAPGRVEREQSNPCHTAWIPLADERAPCVCQGGASDAPEEDRALAAGRRAGAWSMVAWLVFTAVPVLLARYCYQVMNINEADPRHWGTVQYALLLGPI